MTEATNKSLQDKNVWLRGLYMVIFSILLGVAKFVVFAVVVFQFLTVLFSGRPNPRLLGFGESLSIYQYQILMFLTYNSEAHPFPMGDWPETLRLLEERKG